MALTHSSCTFCVLVVVLLGIAAADPGAPVTPADGAVSAQLGVDTPLVPERAVPDTLMQQFREEARQLARKPASSKVMVFDSLDELRAFRKVLDEEVATARGGPKPATATADSGGRKMARRLRYFSDTYSYTLQYSGRVPQSVAPGRYATIFGTCYLQNGRYDAALDMRCMYEGMATGMVLFSFEAWGFDYPRRWMTTIGEPHYYRDEGARGGSCTWYNPSSTATYINVVPTMQLLCE